ncbi:MAG TPA: M35 family metallo-endopeptidase [Steroidobacter sp.]|uniref:M35 family metallo-endopeptidase n=1 Tax=Steroidobacter sp. TaxID=1978227 RepID=UPI002ED7FDA4
MYFYTSLKRYLSVCALIVALTFSLPAAAAEAALQTKLSPVDAFSVDRRVTVRLTFTNNSSEDLYLLAYETPLRGIERDIFVVELDGERMPYTGIVAFRAGPTKEDWIQLAPGAEISEVIDISGAYDTRRSGTYTIRYNAVQQIHQGALPASGTQSLELTSQYAGKGVSSQSIAVTISGTPEAPKAVDAFAKPDVAPDSVSSDQFEWPTATYGCQSPSVITSAQSTARSRALRAYNAATSFNSWYQTWFGNTSSSVSTVRSRFSNAYNRLGQNVDYYCGSYAPYCSAGVVAYTYKTTSNRVYLCSAFWSYSNKGHVIGHESYHWNTVAGADDVTYGSSQCQSLARTRPNDALRNADNYAYAADTAP